MLQGVRLPAAGSILQVNKIKIECLLILFSGVSHMSGCRSLATTAMTINARFMRRLFLISALDSSH